MRPLRIVSVLAVLPVLLVSGLLVGCTSSSIPAAPPATSGTTSLSTPATPVVSKSTQPAGTGDWGTINGTVTWGEKDLPKVAAFGVVPACLVAKKVILDDELIVNPANKGVKNVVVFLIPMKPDERIPVHPSLKEPKEKKVEMDQPCCLFEPRVLAMREDQQLIVKNSAAFPHNFKWVNKLNEGNQAMPANSSFTMEPLKPSYRKILVECNIHGWMKGSIWVFEHPYFALTDEDGKFEIKNAPAGTYKIVFYHDYNGWLNNGNKWGGASITIPAGGTVTVNDKVGEPK
jgi:hypothetical protein